MAAVLGAIIIETAGTEKEATEGLETAIVMEIEEVGKIIGEGSEVGDGTQRALRALDSLTQEAEPSGTTVVDARNGFNELSHLTMIWVVQHLWLTGAIFLFN